jgi:hypothetical protein
MDVPKPVDQVAAEATKRVRVLGRGAIKRNPELLYLAVVDPGKGLMLDRRRAQQESHGRR